MLGRSCDESCVAADPEHLAAAAALLERFKAKTKSQPFELQVTDAHTPHTHVHACMHTLLSHVIQIRGVGSSNAEKYDVWSHCVCVLHVGQDE